MPPNPRTMHWKKEERKDFILGIDAGTKTGLAIWDVANKRFELIKTTMIHRAFDIVKDYHSKHSIKVRVEDARKRTWFGSAGRERLKGVGSVNRDCSAWEDFLTDHKIPFEMVHPKNIKTKLSAEQFKRITGYKGLTSEHSRDSAMMIYQAA